MREFLWRACVADNTARAVVIYGCTRGRQIRPKRRRESDISDSRVVYRIDGASLRCVYICVSARLSPLLFCVCFTLHLLRFECIRNAERGQLFRLCVCGGKWA